MQLLSNKDKGRAGLSLAIAYFGCNGYTVSVPLNDTQDYDLVVDKNNCLQRVSIKFTSQKNSSGKYFQVGLRSMGGSKGSTVYSTFVDSSADLLFVVTENGQYYLIPKQNISAKTQIVLNEQFKDNIVEI